MIRQALGGSKLSGMMEQFTQNYTAYEESKDHLECSECSETFQVEFANDIQKNYAKIKCSPFTQQELTAVNDTDLVFDKNLFHSISQIEAKGNSHGYQRQIYYL